MEGAGSIGMRDWLVEEEGCKWLLEVDEFACLLWVLLEISLIR
jgi:hypothetical protein